jgi:transcriptional regulator with XRE-family HTH domain
VVVAGFLPIRLCWCSRQSVHTQPLTYAALVPCSKSSRRTAVRAAAKRMSQADLARELTARGFSFQHQGVLKLEGGARPLRFEEALALAEIFGVSPAMLSDRPAQAAAAARQLLHVLTDIADVQQRIAELEQDLEHLESVKAEAERRLADAGAVKDTAGQWWFGDTDG